MHFKKTPLVVRCCAFGLFGSLLLAGCSAESGSSDGALDDSFAGAEAAEDIGVEGEAIDKAGSVYIQYCNYPNSWVGTRCIWSSGTSYCGAVRECISDTRSVCGSATPTWTIYTSRGDELMSDAKAYCGL